MDGIDWKHLLFSFDGRINRGKFWLASVAMWVALTILVIIAVVAGSTVVWILAGVAYLGAIWVGLAVTIKRWHDRDKSGWWILIAFVPIIGGLWALIETGFLEGTAGDNTYGPNPLGA